LILQELICSLILCPLQPVQVYCPRPNARMQGFFGDDTFADRQRT
jgi:hypothetical protein